MRRAATPLLLLLALGLLAGGRGGVSRGQDYAVQPESKMWIDGRSTMGAFTCMASEVEGRGRLHEAPARHARDARAVVSIPVRRFDCGNRRMNDDLYDALEADAHPEIRFELLDAAMADSTDALADTSGWHRLRAVGTLTLAGTQRRVDVLVQWQRVAEGRLRGRGEKTLRMSDFGVDPPTALLGLIKARDRITVRFDLVAASAESSTSGGGR